MTHSTPDRLHCVHSLSPAGTTQRIRRSLHEAHATEALWRGFDNFSFVEPLSAEACSDLPSADGRFASCPSFCCCLVLAILVRVERVVTERCRIQCLNHKDNDSTSIHRALEFEREIAGKELIAATGGKHATKFRSGFGRQPLDSVAPALALTLRPAKMLVVGVEWAQTRGGGAPRSTVLGHKIAAGKTRIVAFLTEKRCHNFGSSDGLCLGKPIGCFDA
jgi:hypothetical protein